MAPFYLFSLVCMVFSDRPECLYVTFGLYYTANVMLFFQLPIFFDAF